MGSSLISAMIAVSARMDKKIGKELRSYGSNLQIVPRSSDYLKEDSLLKLKTIFWRHNLVGIAPELKTNVKLVGQKGKTQFIGTWFDKSLKTSEGKIVKTGARQTFPWWKVKGAWPKKEDEILLGSSIAKKIGAKMGSTLSMESKGKVFKSYAVGIIRVDKYKESILGSTSFAQKIKGQKNIVEKVHISAMIVPKLKLPASIRNKKVNDMNKKEYETWYCTPTVGAISTQIKEVVKDARVKNLRQFTEAEGRLLSRLELMIFLTIIISIVATAIAVMTTTTTAIIERRGEIGLAKSIGASNGQIAFQFLAELIVIALGAGFAGYFIGLILAKFIGQAVFKTSVSFDFLTLVITLVLSLAIALVGSYLPIRKATKIQPVVALRGN